MTGPYTPGPWHVGEGKAEVIVYAPDGYAVANAEVFHFNHRRGSAPANARVLAAAPEMLDGTKKAAAMLRRVSCERSEDMALAEELEAIIAKVEGRI